MPSSSKVQWDNVWTMIVPSVLFYIVLSAVIVLQYRRTRDRAFIWLWIALVLWPLNGLFLSHLLMASALAGLWHWGGQGNALGVIAFQATQNIYRYAGHLVTLIAVYKLYRNYASPPVTDIDDKRAGHP